MTSPTTARPKKAGGKNEILANAATRPVPVYLVKGDDPSLIGESMGSLVTALVGDGDPALAVEEHGAPGGDDLDVSRVIDALATPPFITERRVVMVREAGRLNTEDANRLLAVIEVAPPGVVLVLGAGGGTVPAALVKAVGKADGVIDTAVGSGKARREWFSLRMAQSPVQLDRQAATYLEEHLADDASRLPGILAILSARYGVGATVDLEQLMPFVGEAGSAAPWDLTDAIDAGSAADALAVLHRLLHAGDFYPLAITNILHKHYQTMLKLDGVEVGSAEEAAALIGAKSVYPVKKAMAQGRRLGPARLGRAIVLLGEADIDLRGRTALPGETVLEVLVARLSRLAGTSGRSRR